MQRENSHERALQCAWRVVARARGDYSTQRLPTQRSNTARCSSRAHSNDSERDGAVVAAAADADAITTALRYRSFGSGNRHVSRWNAALKMSGPLVLSGSLKMSGPLGRCGEDAAHNVASWSDAR